MRVTVTSRSRSVDGAVEIGGVTPRYLANVRSLPLLALKEAH
jgi:hypothetical protein